MEYKIISISEHPDMIEKAALWFSHKFGIPYEAYINSMTEALEKPEKVPEWYTIINSNCEIIAGAGVIENDFHKRPDLRPNICAVFTDEPYRNQGLMKELLNFICGELNKMGEKEVYLLTDHTEFYERCGFEFFTMVEGDDGDFSRCYKKVLLK